ncbi:hypothetical protein BaRGS_00011068 [Batillaria attramentaria]|uniref:Uncharacterized protein n=1 Tax=Batillaria attramentaria TaxID=370345 RepID=A0ABD0LEN2_9CAEN
MQSCVSKIVLAVAVMTIATQLVVHGEVYSNSSAFYKLQSTLFKGYSPNIRPVRRAADATEVNLHLHVKRIVDVDVKAQKLSQVVYMDIIWKDEFITWDPKKFDNVQNFLVRQKDIWTPDLMFGPHISGQPLRMGHDNMLLMVWYDGRVSWTPDLTIDTACTMDITNYPFDEQRCTWQLYPWMSDKEHVKLTVRNLSDIFDMLISENVEWKLTDVRGQTCDFKNEYFEFSCVKFTYVLKRRATFLVLTVVIPTVMLAVISTLVFALPVDSGEKISLSVAPVLAFVLMLSIMMNVLPQSSLQTSVFVVYLVFLVVCSTLSISLTVAVLSLRRRPDCLPLPKFAITFVRLVSGYGCRCICFSKCSDARRSQSAVHRETGAPPAVYISDEMDGTDTYIFRPYTSNCTSDAVVDRRRSRCSSEIIPATTDLETKVSRISINAAFKCCWRHDAAVEWCDVAKACDYVLFRVFAFVIALATVACFTLMDNGVWSLKSN